MREEVQKRSLLTGPLLRHLGWGTGNREREQREGEKGSKREGGRRVRIENCREERES